MVGHGEVVAISKAQIYTGSSQEAHAAGLTSPRCPHAGGPAFLVLRVHRRRGRQQHVHDVLAARTGAPGQGAPAILVLLGDVRLHRDQVLDSAQVAPTRRQLQRRVAVVARDAVVAAGVQDALEQRHVAVVGGEHERGPAERLLRPVDELGLLPQQPLDFLEVEGLFPEDLDQLLRVGGRVFRAQARQQAGGVLRQSANAFGVLQETTLARPP
mmetsp:Transcript_107506/g.342637  ORF Transcript_107506/g.342637 Transcript_107506/m.342637 type:complete len:213 (-) Transcript_107506:284-922(-)